MLENHALSIEALSRWRKAERARLIAARLAVGAAALAAWRRSIDGHLETLFVDSKATCVAFCWPIKNEYDARHFMKTLRERGALTALPVVVAPKQPLVFREWRPGIELAKGPLDIPYPVGSAEVAPDALLLPVVGFDARCYRLGYGGGYFDRTLANLAPRLLAIGVGYELSRIATIHPQAWDVPLDRIVTEAGLQRR